MSLSISKIEVKNFKSIKKLIFKPNPNFNIIIGPNNIGKTTIFEVLLLWKKCYHHLIDSTGRNFYQGNKHYINFSDLYFLRASSDKDIFHSQGPIEIIVTLSDIKNNKYFNLGIELSRPKSIKNSYLRLIHEKYKEDYKNFAEYLKNKKIKLEEAFFIYQTKPVSTILRQEPFMNSAQILKKINVDKSHEVLRNKIIKCDESRGKIKEGKFDKLSELLEKILEEKYELKISNKSREEEYIKINVVRNNKEIELSLMGSGFLQILEIFSTLDYFEEKNYGVKIMLIDEPDSHIHTNLQKKLIDTLREIKDIQIFVISHNDRFVNQAKNGELFFLNNKIKESGELNSITNIKEINLIKQDLGGTILALEKLNEAQTIIFVEGKDDIEYINLIIDKYNELFENKIDTNKFVFFALRGRGEMVKKIEITKRFISQLSSGKKIGVVFDKDFSTLSAIDEIHKNLSKKLGREYKFSFSHDGYCIESVIFNDKEKLVCLITEIIKTGQLGKSYEIAKEHVFKIVDNVYNDFLRDINDLNSDLIKSLEKKFDSQQSEERPENKNIKFNDFWRENLEKKKISWFLNKENMEKIIKNIFFKCYPYDFEIIDTSTFFKTIISVVDKKSWPDNWNELINNLKD